MIISFLMLNGPSPAAIREDIMQDIELSNRSASADPTENRLYNNNINEHTDCDTLTLSGHRRTEPIIHSILLMQETFGGPLETGWQAGAAACRLIANRPSRVFRVSKTMRTMGFKVVMQTPEENSVRTFSCCSYMTIKGLLLLFNFVFVIT